MNAPLNAKESAARRSIPGSQAATPFVRRLLTGNAVIILLVTALTTLSLYQSLHEFRERAANTGRNLTQVIEQNVAAVIDKTDVCLRTVGLEVDRRKALNGRDAGEMNRFLEQQRALLPELTSLRVIDADGHIIYGYGSESNAGLNVADRDYFRQAKSNAKTGLLISQPILSRISNYWVIILARRLENPDGSFAGLVSASIRADYFQSLFAHMKLGGRDSISLRTGDLHLIARLPANEAAAAAIGGDRVSAELRQALARDPENGTYVATTYIDNIERTLTYSRVGEYPLYILVGIANADTLADWRKEASKIALLAALVVLVTLLSSWLSYRGWKRQRLADEALARESQRNQVLLHTASDGIHILGDGARLLEVNEAFCNLLGYRREELIGMGMADLDIAMPTETFTQPLHLLFGAGRVFETRLRRKDGTGIDVEISATSTEIDGQQLVFASARDISRRKQAEYEEQRLRRALELLGDSNLALVHADAEHHLLPEICRLIVAKGGYLMAWVGLAQHDAEKSVIPVAQAGAMAGYLESIHITWGDGKLGEGPTGTAIRTGRTQVAQNVLTNPRMAPWRNMALTYGHQSSIALPLIGNDGVLGAISIYAADPEAFGPEEVKLLEKLTDNLAFGIEARRTGSRLAAERSFSQSLTDSFPGIFYVIGKNQRFVRWNKTFEEATGKSAAELQQISPLDLFEGSDRKLMETGIARVFAQGAATAEIRMLTANSGSCPYLMTGRRVTLDGETLIVGLGVDVSPVKSMEAELERHRNHLEDLVVQRTAELSAARQAAEAASRAKSVFLANMSHEIRTPMNAILGLTHLLQRAEPPPETADKLAKIGDAARHLLSVINDILDISKIEAGKLSLDIADFELPAVFAKINALIADKAAAQGLELTTEIDPALAVPLTGDPLRLEQILLNFASNALKFTEHGRIAFRVRRLPEIRDGRVLVRCEVSDTGIGIAPEAQGRLFQAFEQADGSTTRKYGGTGLGLAISRRLAELMGGEIGVDSTPGQGSTFWFTAWLGCGEGPLAGAQPSLDACGALRAEFPGARVLLAEDEPLNQEIAREFLEDSGLRVDVADDGEAALEQARRNDYDLILMDMQMPVMDGLAATQAIRRLPGHRRTPILAMTANAFAEDRQRCLDAGMDDHIAKPFEPEEFLATLLQWLRVGSVDYDDVHPARAVGAENDGLLDVAGT